MAAKIIEGITSSVGEEIAVIGGQRTTRVAVLTAIGDTSVTVETTDGWETAGEFAAGDFLYSYTGITSSTITGITWLDGDTVNVGVGQVHSVGDEVADATRLFNQIDIVKSKTFLRTADGADLDIVGNNYAIPRPFQLGGADAQYRDLVQALALAPKGTMSTIRHALDAIFGAGHYKLWENFPTFRNTVFVQVTDSPFVDHGVSDGKTFFQARVRGPYDNTANTVTVPTPVSRVCGVALADENFITRFNTVKPSALTETRYSGDSGAPFWVYDGASEGADVVQETDSEGYVRLTDNSNTQKANYQRTARIVPQSDVYLEWGVRFRSANLSTGSTAGMQVAMLYRDGERDVCVGSIRFGAGAVDIGFVDTSTGSFIGTPFRLTTAFAGDFHGIAVRRNTRDGTDHVSLLVGGVKVDSVLRSAFNTSALHEVRFGCITATQQLQSVDVRYAALYAHTDVDYWNKRGTATAGTTSRLDDGGASFAAGDVGKRVRSSGSALPRNNGDWVVASRTGTTVTLKGTPRTLALVTGAHPTQVQAVHDQRAFKYPDDVGKVVDLTAAVNVANQGSFPIASIVDPVTGSPFSGTSVGYSDRCLVTGASFIAETGIAWKIDPNFHVADADIKYEIADQGSKVGGVLTLPADPFTLPGGYVLILDALYSQFASGHITAGPEVRNQPADTLFPAYLPENALGPLRQLVDELTVAGVILEIVL